MRATRFAFGALLLLGSTSVASFARGADSDTARARALFEAAGELERDGRWSAAQDRLRAALRLRETPQLHFALGWALENDDKLIEAKVAYETAARLGRERQGAEEALRLAIARLGDLETMTPIIRVRLASSTSKPNARVIVDGSEVLRADFDKSRRSRRRGVVGAEPQDNIAATLVNPGSHVVRIERGASGATEHMVYVGRSAERTVDVDTNETVATSDTTQNDHGPTTAAPAPPIASGDPTSDREALVPWLVLSGGVAFVAAGGALLFASANDHEGGQTKEALGLTMGSIGLVGATVGAMLLLRTIEPGLAHKTPTKSAMAAPIRGGGMATATFSF
jgi:hypothetical protein